VKSEEKLPSLLGRWYGDPLDRETAERLLANAQQRQTVRLRAGRSCYTCRLQQMVAHYWFGKEIDEEFHALRLPLLRTAHGRILAELIYGQLLMSQRRSGAMESLNSAFHNARNLLTPCDYFVLFKRHNLLNNLPLGSEAQKALSLDELVTTAAVIERLSPSRKSITGRDDGNSL
jgi:hypothetical protein